MYSLQYFTYTFIHIWFFLSFYAHVSSANFGYFSLLFIFFLRNLHIICEQKFRFLNYFFIRANFKFLVSLNGKRLLYYIFLKGTLILKSLFLHLHNWNPCPKSVYLVKSNALSVPILAVT